MLVFSRKVGDDIIINDDIHIKILSIANNQIKIGIDAPRDIDVHRGEIYRKIHGIEGNENEVFIHHEEFSIRR